VYTTYCEASRRSPLSRFSKTTFSPPQRSALANDGVMPVSGSPILPLRFETAKVPAAPSTPVRPATTTAEEPRAPIQASRYCDTQYYETARCSPLSRRSKAPSQQLPALVNVAVVPAPGSNTVPSHLEVIKVPTVPAAPSTPVHQVKAARGEEEPRAPIQVRVRISISSFPQTNSITALSLCVYCILRGFATLPAAPLL
jgi:hypothetical protein